MTDANGVGKQANFNQYLIERIGTFLVAMGAIQAEEAGPYSAGPNLDAFWNHDIDRVRMATREAILHLVQDQTGYQPWRPQDDPSLETHRVPHTVLLLLPGPGTARIPRSAR